jgi:alpha-L-fucosidase
MAGTNAQWHSFARIPVIQEERLVEIGKWLAVYGQAIYGTK